MEAATAGEPRRFEYLREHSMGLPQVLFQSTTHVAPAAAVAYSFFISVATSQQALPLSVGLALTAFLVLVRPDKLRNIDRVYVEDETVAPESPPAAGSV